MPKFKLPVTWEMCGEVEVQAPSLVAAIAGFDGNLHSLPLDTAMYVDASFRLTTTNPEEVHEYQKP